MKWYPSLPSHVRQWGFVCLHTQSVEQILVTPDGTKLITLGARGSSTGTFGVFRSVRVYAAVGSINITA